MFPIYLCLHCLTVSGISLLSCTFWRTSPLVTLFTHLIFVIFLWSHISNWYGFKLGDCVHVSILYIQFRWQLFNGWSCSHHCTTGSKATPTGPCQLFHACIFHSRVLIVPKEWSMSMWILLVCIWINAQEPGKLGKAASQCVKVKGAMLQWGIGGVLIGRPHIGLWARRWIDHWVCDAWPVLRQTYGYLPSRRASPPLRRYQIILLGDRGTWVWTMWWPEVELTISWSQIQCPKVFSALSNH